MLSTLDMVKKILCSIYLRFFFVSDIESMVTCLSPLIKYHVGLYIIVGYNVLAAKLIIIGFSYPRKLMLGGLTAEI